MRPGENWFRTESMGGLCGVDRHQITEMLFIIIIIIIIIHIHYVTAVQLVLKTVRSHWPNTSYSLFCQKLSDYSACIKYYCFLH
jgi:hypothetical protein